MSFKSKSEAELEQIIREAIPLAVAEHVLGIRAIHNIPSLWWPYKDRRDFFVCMADELSSYFPSETE